MAIKYNREKISDGIHYTTLINERQKTNTTMIHLVTTLSNDTVSLNAAIPYILANSNSKYTTVTELSKKLASLYGSVIKGTVSKIGDSQVLTLMSGCINDKYTFDGEAITQETTQILLDCLTSPYIENGGFYAKDFELKKQELIDDIEAEINEKRSYAFKRANAKIFENEPCAISVKGDLDTANQLNPVNTYEQYKKLLKSSQIEIVFVGSAEPVTSKEIIKNTFNSLERDYAGDNSSAKSSSKTEVCRITEPHDVAQSKMVMAFKTDYDNIAAMKLMNSVFGGTPFSKLFMNVREKLSLCYYCSSGVNDKKGVVYVDSGVEHANVKKAEDEILNQLKSVQNGEITDEELENARLAIINSWRGVSDGARSLADWYFQRSYSGGSESPEEFIEQLKKVTKDDVIKAANSLKLDTVYVLTGKEVAENA